MIKLSKALEVDYKTFIHMTKKEQKEVAQKINSTVSRRMRELKKAGADSFAKRKYEKAGGLQSVKGQNTYELWRSVTRGKTFLEAKTSTVSGYKSVIQQTAENIRQPEYERLSNEQRSDFWSLYNEIEETGFFEELRAKDLSSDYIQSIVYELHESGYTYEDATSAIEIMREEFGVYDKLHRSPIKEF